MGKALKLGVIGWGLRGGLAKLAHRPDEDAELVALADPDDDACARFKSVFPDARTVPAAADLLELGLDGVFVCSPDWLHEEQAVMLLEAGIGVFLEKPMAITTEGCDRILEASKTSGSRLYVGHNMRHFSVVQAMKRLIDKGRIGRVTTAWCRQFVSYGGDAYYRDWHADRTKSNGLLLQKGAHDIDVLHHLCGGYSRRVTAMGKLAVYGGNEDRQQPGDKVKVEFRKTWPPASLDKLNPVVDVEDTNLMLMELDNGVMCSYQHVHYSPDSWRNYTVIGTEGRIENFGDGPGATVKLWNRARYGFDLQGDEEIHMPPEEGGHGGADPKMVSEFLRFLREGGRTETSPIAARQAVAAGCSATTSLRSGSVPVDVPILDPSTTSYFEGEHGA